MTDIALNFTVCVMKRLTQNTVVCAQVSEVVSHVSEFDSIDRIGRQNLHCQPSTILGRIPLEKVMGVA